MSDYSILKMNYEERLKRNNLTLLYNARNLSISITDVFPDNRFDIESQNEIVLFLMCVYGEARGECFDGMKGVASVILNRVYLSKIWPNNIRDVILQPKQFSCFNKNDVNRGKLLNPDVVRWIQIVNNIALCYFHFDSRWLKDATHYFSIKIKPPKWAETLRYVTTIDNHKFYSIFKNREIQKV